MENVNANIQLLDFNYSREDLTTSEEKRDAVETVESKKVDNIVTNTSDYLTAAADYNIIKPQND